MSLYIRIDADGQEFIYGIDDIVRYYKSCVSLMVYRDEVLSCKVLRLHDEHVVDDTEH